MEIPCEAGWRVHRSRKVSCLQSRLLECVVVWANIKGYRYRVYCADPHCARFLHPSTYVEDKDNDITYAVCEAESCGKITCVRCKALLQHEKHAHECGPNEEDRKFKQMATEKGYKACPVCGVTVELAEACNHVM